MKNYSIEKYNNILKEDVLSKSSIITEKLKKYASTILPQAFVEDRVLLCSIQEGAVKQFLCKYDLTEESVKLYDIEEVVVKKSYMSEAVKNIFSKMIKEDKITSEDKLSLLEAMSKQIDFNLDVYGAKSKLEVKKQKRTFSKKLTESVKRHFEGLKKIQQISISNAKDTIKRDYKLVEGKECVILFSKPPITEFKNKFTWIVRQARKSLRDNIIQVPIMEKMMKAYIEEEVDEPMITVLVESYASNVEHAPLITRADIFKILNRVAGNKSINISKESNKELATKIHNCIVKENKDEIIKMLEEVYGDINAVAEHDVSNAICIYRKVKLLKEIDEKDVPQHEAMSVLSGEEDEVVDNDVEAATDESSSEDYEYTIDDVEDFINVLKRTLKELDPEAFQSHYKDEDVDEDPNGLEDDTTEEFPNPEDKYEDDSDMFESDIKSKSLITEDNDEVVGVFEDEETDLVEEDDTGDVIEDISDNLDLDDDAQEIVNMIDELDTMKEKEQIDGERVSEIGKWIFDYLEQQGDEKETDDEAEEKEKEGKTDGVEDTDDEDIDDEMKDTGEVSESKK